MPLLPTGYRAPWPLRNGHVHTVFPVWFRRVPKVHYQREVLELSDGDFLDLDWARIGGDRVGIITHGLEGSSRRQYVLGMVKAFHRRGWDAVAVNMRGCGGTPNRLLRFYHSGVSEDLGEVLNFVLKQRYQKIGLVGFSLGGNVTLKLLSELGDRVSSRVVGGVGISVPCDLKSSARRMSGLAHRPYMKRFLMDLEEKIRRKQPAFPGKLDLKGYHRLKTFQDFDDRYTAPLHGFADAADYWRQASSIRVLPGLKVPALLLNALDDPFLGEECFPTEMARSHPWFHLELPPHGGHVGFVGGGEWAGEYYSERRALEFLMRDSNDQRAVAANADRGALS